MNPILEWTLKYALPGVVATITLWRLGLGALKKYVNSEIEKEMSEVKSEAKECRKQNDKLEGRVDRLYDSLIKKNS